MSHSASRPAIVSLHPLASRHGNHSSTIVAVDAAPAGPRTQADCQSEQRKIAPSSASFTYGIHHDNLDDYPVIYDPSLPSGQDYQPIGIDDLHLSSPIRAISVAQLDQLHDQYVSLDVPHHVVFPFLHGVDGSIPAQNAFFNAPPNGQPTPNYRGLTIVRADMPSSEELERIHTARSRTRASTFSSVNTQSSGSPPASEDGSTSDASWLQQSRSRSIPLVSAYTPMLEDSHHAASTKSAEISSASQLIRPSLLSLSSERYSAGSRTSVSTASDFAEDSDKEACPIQALRHISPTLADAQPNHSILNSTVFPKEIIRPPTISKRRCDRTTLSDPHTPIYLGDDEDDHQEIRRVGASFLNPAQASGISLRNFKTQCAKYATISDIVIYCPVGYHSGVLTLAKWICEAQASLRRERIERGWGGLSYNVFVVTDSFDVFESNCAHLVSVDSHGFNRNRINFVDREREEMERLTRASEIDDNVWLGCTADAPGNASDKTWSAHGPVTPDDNSNPNSFAICIQNMEMVDAPTSASLRSASHYLDTYESTAALESQRGLDLRQEDLFNFSSGRPSLRDIDNRCESRNGMLVLGPNGWTPKSSHSSMQSDMSAARQGQACHASYRARQSDLQKHAALQLEASRILHLEFPANGDRGSRPEWTEMMATRVLEMCNWIKQQACPVSVNAAAAAASAASSGWTFWNQEGDSADRSSSPSQRHERRRSQGSTKVPVASRRPRRILLHCADGYTETSVLALAYLMFSRELSLPEAYLDLQLRADRSFFVYPSDVPVLERIDSMLKLTRSTRSTWCSYNAVPVDARRYKHAMSKSHGANVLYESQQSILRPVSLSLANSSTRSTADTIQPTAPFPDIGRTSTPTPQTTRKTSDVAKSVDHSWFDRKRFDGAFPSRILPFLYLGNLAHASNVDMLQALGITHLVSVGETALNPPDHISARVNDRKDHLRSRYQRATSKAAMSKDPRTVPSLTYEAEGITVLNVRNVSDDGIDSLRGTMREAVQFIESARLSGGKVLVHCRVGVSRSTTVVLAYVMAYLDLGLVESYLLVRSRRLNIVIQPHLLFLWELRGWECFLHKMKGRRASVLQNSLAGGQSPESLQTAFSRLSAQSFQGGSGRSEEGSDTYQSAHSSPSVSPVLTAMSVDDEENDMHLFPALDDEPLLDVEIGAGAGSVHGFKVNNIALLPFGSGSPAGLAYKSSRLMWGHLAREIADLNSRYFV